MTKTKNPHMDVVIGSTVKHFGETIAVWQINYHGFHRIVVIENDETKESHWEISKLPCVFRGFVGFTEYFKCDETPIEQALKFEKGEG